MIISFILFILAAISNSIMDTCSHHFTNSIFSKLNSKFWNSEISWRNKYINNDPKNGMKKILFGLINYPVFLTDSWHLFKSLTILFICCSIATFKGYIVYEFLNQLFNIIIAIVIYGILWNCFFNLFYNHILLKRNL